MAFQVFGFVAAVAVLVDLGEDLGAVGLGVGEVGVEVVDVDPDAVVKLRGAPLGKLEKQDRASAYLQLDPGRIRALGRDLVQESRPKTVCSQRAAAAGSS